MPLNGYSSTLPSDVLTLPAIVRIGSTNLGVTKGPINFDGGFEFENLEFDGKQAPIKGLDRRFNGEAKMSFTILELGEAATGNQIDKLEPGNSVASAGSPNVTTVTPAAGGTFLASADYESNVRLIWDRGIGAGTRRYCTVHYASALVKKYTISGGGTRGVAEIGVEIEARKDMASGTVADSPYVIEYREALP